MCNVMNILRKLQRPLIKSINLIMYIIIFSGIDILLNRKFDALLWLKSLSFSAWAVLEITPKVDRNHFERRLNQSLTLIV